MDKSILVVLLVLPYLANSQDFGFENEIDNRIHVMGNRPDRFRYFRPYAPLNCTVGDLDKRVLDAQVIFTGTVRRLYNDLQNPNMFKGQVEIKRVLKGREIINRLPGVYPESNDIYWPWSRRLVIVNGIGNPKICRNQVRKYDTRIFMTTEAGNRELKLNSSLERLTLDNIHKSEAAIEGSKFKPKPTEAPSDPCERVFCAFGAHCMVDSDTNTGKCQCAEKCSSLFSPVCGSDSTTYSSICHLRRASCSEQKRILVKYHGSCNDKNDVKDPCKNMQCHFGAECIPSYDGQSARCQCPAQCNSYGDSDNSVAVCGSDGRDYTNECEMRKAACSSMRDITVKYNGQCDPCNGHVCDRHEVCQLDAKRRPECRCKNNCHMVQLSQVCGTDGNTYSSQCLLEVEACKTRRNINVVHSGSCQSGPNPCAQLRCGYLEECHIDRSGKALCICPPSCEPVQKPVCGSDGMTYDNQCELQRQACLTKRVVNIIQHAACNPDSPCRDYRCHHGAMCIVENNQPTCRCPSCNNDYKPVCGSNNITYNNECDLRAAACASNNLINIAHTGPCQDACTNFKCDNYGVCEVDMYGRPSCICTTYCTEMDKPVCGTDGVTYSNECQMKVASCQRQNLIKVASEGHCDKCHNVFCKYGSRCENGHCVCPSACSLHKDPVCASNGKTYDNECRMLMESCNLQVDLTVEYSGECDERDFSGSGEFSDDDRDCNEANCRFGGICEFEINNGRSKCTCDFSCNAIRDTVCGSDGNTYGNVCQLREQACMHQTAIQTVSPELCGELLEEPCDGSPAVVDPSTGREYRCAKTGSQNCPANSYCHIIEGQSMGRCCKQDEQPIRNCHETEHGCCPDKRTASPGPNYMGCPSVCDCNPHGSQGLTCDPLSGQCSCKPGVGGLRCDRCEPGFWGLPLIAQGNSGCIPCNCNLYGSIRDDCEQEQGKCVCKPGITGLRCDTCANGMPIGANGCSDGSLSEPQALRELETSGGNRKARTCSEMYCHFGAVCKMEARRPKCVCPDDCQNDRALPSKICASNGEIYYSECQIRYFSCRLQQHIAVIDCENGVTPRATTKSRKTTRHINNRITNSDSIAATPSTPEYGYLGDICRDDQDCIPRDSYCRNGLCDCISGLLRNRQNTACEDLLNAMLSDGLGHSYTVPSFSGINSYLQINKIHHASGKITIELTFKALSNEGVLFYTGKSLDGSGDFISLALKDGFVEFRYDLGSGPLILRSQTPVTLNKFHKIKASRFYGDGRLYMDDVYQAAGKSPGNLKNLNLDTDVYIGWVPNAGKNVYNNIGTAMAFSGCIEAMTIKAGKVTHVYDLIAPESADVIQAENIAECGNNACASMPCLNSGSCMSQGADQFICKCPPGFTGDKCETSSRDGHDAELCRDQSYCRNGGTCYDLPTFGDLMYCECPPQFSGSRCEIQGPPEHSITVPMFHGDSYLEIPLDVNPARAITFELWFLTLQESGVLLYSQQQRGEDRIYLGDFISLNLVNGHLQFTFNLGSGIANITSRNRLPLNVWHRVTASRRGLEGEMIINQGERITERSQGKLSVLNIPNKLYVGGFPEQYNVLSGASAGLHGAIQRLYIDGSLVDGLYRSASYRQHVTQYTGPPCPQDNPCQNEGKCVPQLNDYSCGCTDMYTGRHCQLLKSDVEPKSSENPALQEVELINSVAFDGATNQQYNNMINRRDTSQATNKYEITFNTRSDSGLLVLQHKSNTVEGDYLTIGIRSGRVEASYNLGKARINDPLDIRSKVRVDDGQWHTLVFTRDRRKGELTVDNEMTVLGLAPNGATQLDTDGKLWIGGSLNPPRGLPKAYHGFVGCIASVKINDRPLDLVTNRVDAGSTQYCDLITI